MQKSLEFLKKLLWVDGYSFINSRMAFDTDVLLKDPKNEKVLFKTVDGQLKRF